MPTRVILIALAVSVLLAGCGRRGGLEAPGAEVEPDPLFVPSPLGESQSPGAQDPEPRAEPAAPDRPFVLDPLI
jgi:predicted small lipoprotein YifL